MMTGPDHSDEGTRNPSKQGMKKSVDALLDDIRMLGPEHYEIVQAVRKIVQSTVSPLSEEVKYGGILFSSGIHFCGVFAYSAHVSVEFGQGARIEDVDRVLEGAGKNRRHIKLRSAGEIETNHLAKYIGLALGAAMSEQAHRG